MSLIPGRAGRREMSLPRLSLQTRPVEDLGNWLTRGGVEELQGTGPECPQPLNTELGSVPWAASGAAVAARML